LVIAYGGERWLTDGNAYGKAKRITGDIWTRSRTGNRENKNWSGIPGAI
jgi:hypothetical protein